MREIELPSGGGKREATCSETREYDKWRSERVTQGLPPWVSRDNSNQFRDAVALRSSKTLRQWADEYCASPKLLKEFMYEKVSRRSRVLFSNLLNATRFYMGGI